MSEIETPAPGDVRARRIRGVAAGALWIAATVLSLLAAYSSVYSVRYTVGGQVARYSVDMTGHYGGAGAGAFPQSGAHYSVVLIVCAVAFALLALATLGRAFDLPSGPRLDLAVTGGGFGAAGVLAGALIALYLQTDSILDNIADRVSAGASLGTPVQHFATSVDAAPYLALSALGCAVVGLAVTYWGRVTTRDPAGINLEDDPVPVHADVTTTDAD